MEGLYSLIALLLSFHLIHPFLIAMRIGKTIILWMLVLHLLDNDEIVVKGDKARISEAMWNLLNKVIKFIEEEHFLRQEKKMIIPF